MITGSTLSHQKAQKFLREYHAWGRVYFGGKCKTSDVQKAIGLFKNDHSKFIYFHFSYAETDNQQINITPKQYNTLRKLAVKRFTMID